LGLFHANWACFFKKSLLFRLNWACFFKKAYFLRLLKPAFQAKKSSCFHAKLTCFFKKHAFRLSWACFNSLFPLFSQRSTFASSQADYLNQAVDCLKSGGLQAVAGILFF
jgi:hypothetical protein